MSERSWFFAAGGQQQGPYGEAQFRDLIARGTVNADTLVWNEGMAGWQRAGDVPGLLSNAAGPPAIPRAGGAMMGGGGYGGGALSIDFGIWEFIWRTIVAAVGSALIIPAPWLLTWYTNWMVSRVHVPGRPALSFAGRGLTIAPWFFGAVVLEAAAYWSEIPGLPNAMSLVWLALHWLFIRYFIANLASSGQPLGLSFAGSFWGYFGWNLLAGLSFLTIIGWAWVYTALLRWMCRNVQGTRREVVYKGTGLEYLWRAIVTVIASAFIIPIPWVARWLISWVASKTELVERNVQARI